MQKEKPQSKSAPKSQAAELDQCLKNFVKKERELLHSILKTILQIEEQKAYLELGYESLFTYLVNEIKYSKSTAQRRIDAALLLLEVPDLGAKIEEGSVNLGHLTLLQTAVRQAEKSGEEVSPQEKTEVLEQIAGKDLFESAKEIATHFELPALQQTKVRPQSDGSIRMELTIPADLFAEIQEAQGLLSHAIQSGDLVDYLRHLTKMVIRQKRSVRARRQNAEQAPRENSEPMTQGKVPDGTRVQFTPQMKKMILNRQRTCQHVDPETGRKCQSNWYLQVDHIIPVWAGGLATFENAQVLCGVHNRLKYQRQAGRRVG
jgi:5-methylcytosine-specific restriction endonuclease McrA